jgi:hypothetical protein
LLRKKKEGKKELHKRKCIFLLLGIGNLLYPSRLAILNNLGGKFSLTLNLIDKRNEIDEELLFHSLSSSHLNSNKEWVLGGTGTPAPSTLLI